jgi:hypothetical protein
MPSCRSHNAEPLPQHNRESRLKRLVSRGDKVVKVVLDRFKWPAPHDWEEVGPQVSISKRSMTIQDHNDIDSLALKRIPWSKGKLTGAKPPLCTPIRGKIPRRLTSRHFIAVPLIHVSVTTLDVC